MSNTSEIDLLQTWLDRQLAGEAKSWLRDSLSTLAEDHSDRTFYKLFGFVPRKIGKDDLQLAADDLADAADARPAWNPAGWSVDQAGRLLLLLRSEADSQKLFARIEQLCITADVGEQVALYRGLPLYPEPSLYVMRGAEGIRTNIRSVFEAVAHRNPFPREQFGEEAWNQMVLKALFIESPLWPMQGLDERANATLAVMLVDYAHERWAASRAVSPELWRCVGPHANEQALDDLQRVLSDGNEREQHAAALALASCPSPRAKELLKTAGEFSAGIRDGSITWEAIVAAGQAS